jgi:biopolymer transport protein ExbD
MVEMQMGPMIDIVFLLLIFFLVTAKPIKPESDVDLKLPGTVEQDEALVFPDEQRIRIRTNGQVALNDLDMDNPSSLLLPQLTKVLTRFKEAADKNKSQALVTIDAEDEVIHQRIVDVLSACASAGIVGVTFAMEEEEEF